MGFHLTVNQLCFRPAGSNRSLQLAGCSSDGTVRIFTIRLTWSVFNQEKSIFCFVTPREKKNTMFVLLLIFFRSVLCSLIFFSINKIFFVWNQLLVSRLSCSLWKWWSFFWHWREERLAGKNLERVKVIIVASAGLFSFIDDGKWVLPLVFVLEITARMRRWRWAKESFNDVKRTACTKKLIHCRWSEDENDNMSPRVHSLPAFLC